MKRIEENEAAYREAVSVSVGRSLKSDVFSKIYRPKKNVEKLKQEIFLSLCPDVISSIIPIRN